MTIICFYKFNIPLLPFISSYLDYSLYLCYHTNDLFEKMSMSLYINKYLF